jgi:prepilin-type N-terminal cleavage/methylation domain-containing protein
MKRAFTLIELLVVIAIIAILAAILFPVFAQAKAAAKKASSISNTKQEALAVIMYAGDVDDMICSATNWSPQSSPNGYPFNFGAGWAGPWTWLVLPYVKNGGIFQDPQTQGTANVFNNTEFSQALLPSYGFNYVWLSPWDGTKQTPVSMTSVDKPSQTVLISSKWANAETTLGANGFLGFTFNWAAPGASGNGPLLNYTVEVPECGVIPQDCANNWGVGSLAPFVTTIASGSNTGGNSQRSGGQTVVAWIDGHTKAMAPGALAAGTNWTPTIAPGAVNYVTGWQDSNLWGAK